jgi:cyclopropane-fatty-acyl-phospholipid synthase
MAGPGPLPVAAESWDEAAHGVPGAARRALRLAAGIACGGLALELPDGRRLRIRGPEPGPDAALAIRDYRFARRLALGGGLGLAESYLRGEWDTPDLPALLHLLALNRHLAASLPANRPAARSTRPGSTRR